MKIKLDIPKTLALIDEVEKEGTFLGIGYGFLNDKLYLKLEDVIELLGITDLETILIEYDLWWYGEETWVYLPVALFFSFRSNKDKAIPFILRWRIIANSKDTLRRISYE